MVLTYFINAFNLASGAIQVRISEALCVLPFFTPAAIPGLFLGCLISNLLTGRIIWDVIFGSLATLLGALGTWLLTGRAGKAPSSRKTKKWLAPLPPILANTLIVPFVLYYAYQFPGSVPIFGDRGHRRGYFLRNPGPDSVTGVKSVSKIYILISAVGDKAIAILGKPFRGIVHPLFIKSTGGRFHNHHIIFVKACYQHGFTVL